MPTGTFTRVISSLGKSSPYRRNRPCKKTRQSSRQKSDAKPAAQKKPSYPFDILSFIIVNFIDTSGLPGDLEAFSRSESDAKSTDHFGAVRPNTGPAVALARPFTFWPITGRYPDRKRELPPLFANNQHAVAERSD